MMKPARSQWICEVARPWRHRLHELCDSTLVDVGILSQVDARQVKSEAVDGPPQADMLRHAQESHMVCLLWRRI